MCVDLLGGGGGGSLITTASAVMLVLAAAVSMVLAVHADSRKVSHSNAVMKSDFFLILVLWSTKTGLISTRVVISSQTCPGKRECSI